MGNICSIDDTQRRTTEELIAQKRNSEQLDLKLQETEAKFQALLFTVAAKELQFATLQREANDSKALLQHMDQTHKREIEAETRLRQRQQTTIRLIFAISTRSKLAFYRWKMLTKMDAQVTSQLSVAFIRKVATVLENVQESAVLSSFSIMRTILKQRSNRFSSKSLEPLSISEDLMKAAGAEETDSINPRLSR